MVLQYKNFHIHHLIELIEHLVCKETLTLTYGQFPSGPLCGARSSDKPLG